MDIREKLRKAAGLFVELPPEETPPERETETMETPVPPTRTVEQIVRESDGPNLDEIHVSAESASPPTVGADGRVEFGAIYAQANLPAAPFSAEQMLDMLQSLPAELPLAVKRQTDAVTLNAMGKSLGASPETIVADASRKLAALAAYAEALSKQTTQNTTTDEAEIASLEAQIAEKRQAIASAKQQQTQAVQVCAAESDRLDDVLEFFSLDVPPSKHA